MIDHFCGLDIANTKVSICSYFDVIRTVFMFIEVRNGLQKKSYASTDLSKFSNKLRRERLKTTEQVGSVHPSFLRLITLRMSFLK